MKNKFYLIIIAVFSILINQYFGHKGVFPIDSFVIFDAAYNVTSSNHPFKDYWLITGPLLDYIQSLFFIIFGINWFSYVLHASTLNMALALFSFYFFINIGLKNYYAFIYSIGVAILAYPTIGTPFVDHHSVIFSVMAVYSFSLGFLLKRNLFFYLTPVFLTFSFFSKQIPSSYLLVLFIIAFFFCFFFTKNLNKKNLLYILLGSFFSLLLISSIFFINAIPIKNFFIQYVFYPSSLGGERIDRLNVGFKNLIAQFKFIYVALIPLVVSTILLINKKAKKLSENNLLTISLILLGSVMIFIYCQLLTKNQVLIFFLIPICAAYSHAYTIKYFNNKFIIYFILVIFIFSTAKYHIRFNHHKKFLELANADFNLAIEATELDKRLYNLKWISPAYLENPQKEIDLLIDIKNTLSEVKERKIIVTDYQFFSSLLNNEFASPNKWYDELSVPNKNNKYYHAHKDFFLKKIKKNKIKYIYFIGKYKHEMNFFNEIAYENECIISKKINELLVEFDINECKQIL